MNISLNGHKLLGALFLGLCLFAATPSDAHWGWGGRGHGWGWGHGWGPGWGYGGFYRGGGLYIGPGPAFYRPYYNCGWVGGHWRHGYWVPGYRACW